MRGTLVGLALSAGLLSTASAAEVISASANAFHLRHVVQLVTPTATTFESFGQVSKWWDSEHTYSGDAANLSMALTPGGCFCERIPKSGGGVEHLRVTYVEPGQRLVLTGSLGPLLYEATTGSMDIKVERIAGGSRLTMDYKVAGFASDNGEKLAPLVDSVLGNQIRRFRTFAAGRP